MTSISIIIPVLNEEKVLPKTLESLKNLKQVGVEIIVVDGGSHDQTVKLAKQYASQTICSTAGRSKQMNAGANIATGNLLLFLHADTQLPANVLELLNNLHTDSSLYWGRFNVKLDDSSCGYRIIETMMNWRSFLTGIATGDQSIFVSKTLFEQVGGYPDIDLMEDIAMSKKLKRLAAPICISSAVSTSSRRWEENGILKTVFFMWALRLAFFFKVNPVKLAKKYRQIRLK